MYSNALYPNAGYYNEGGQHEFHHVSHSVVWQRQRSRGANQRGVVILPWTGQQCQSVQRRTQRVWSISAGFTIVESKDRMKRGPGRGRLPNENLQRISRLLGECLRLITMTSRYSRRKVAFRENKQLQQVRPCTTLAVVKIL